MRKHPCFSKLRKGDTVTDNTGDEFEVLEIDRRKKKAMLRDLQDRNSEFWISSIFINKPELLDEAGECF